LQEKLFIGNDMFFLNEQELSDYPVSKFHLYLKEFRLEMGLPVWLYQIGDFLFEKRILLQHSSNTVLIQYHLLEAPSPIDVELRPAVHFRALEASVDQDSVHDAEYVLTAKENIYQLQGGCYP